MAADSITRTPEQELWDLLVATGYVADRIRGLQGFGRPYRILCRVQLELSQARDMAEEIQHRRERTGRWPQLTIYDRGAL